MTVFPIQMTVMLQPHPVLPPLPWLPPHPVLPLLPWLPLPPVLPLLLQLVVPLPVLPWVLIPLWVVLIWPWAPLESQRRKQVAVTVTQKRLVFVFVCVVVVVTIHWFYPYSLCSMHCDSHPPDSPLLYSLPTLHYRLVLLLQEEILAHI